MKMQDSTLGILVQHRHPLTVTKISLGYREKFLFTILIKDPFIRFLILSWDFERNLVYFLQKFFSMVEPVLLRPVGRLMR